MAHGMDARTRQERGMAPKAAKKELEHIRVAEAENGGHTVHHHFTSFEHPPEGPHIFPEMEGKHPVVKGSLFHHLAKHLNIPHSIIEEKEPEMAEKEQDPMEEEMEEKVSPGIHKKVAKMEEEA